MLTIVGSVGGCGATTVITHLAAAIARLDGATHKVCVIDLDLQGGEIVYYVGLEPRVTISALLEAGDRLDTELLHSAITETNHGFSLIASPTTITPLDDVNEDHLLKLLRLIRQEFDFVLIDLPTDWTSWGLSVAAASSRVLMVMELSVASMRQAKRRLQLFDSVGIALGDVDLLANRIEHKLFHSIGVNEIDNVLGKPALATLSDEDHMMSAQNEGRLIDDIHAHTRFSKDIENLARLLISQKVEMP
jgi:pilus assembly protein CpaE